MTRRDHLSWRNDCRWRVTMAAQVNDLAIERLQRARAEMEAATEAARRALEVLESELLASRAKTPQRARGGK